MGRLSASILIAGLAAFLMAMSNEQTPVLVELMGSGAAEEALLASLAHDQPVPGARIVALKPVDHARSAPPMLVVDGGQAFDDPRRNQVIAAIKEAAARPHAVMELSETQLVIRRLPPGWANRLLIVEVTDDETERYPIDSRKLPITLSLPAGTHRTAVLRPLEGTQVLGTATI